MNIHNKKNRQKIFDKYNGHCAYCGTELNKSWNIDHIWPKQLSHWHKDLDENREENLNPSCRRCNNFKHGMRLEDFRQELQRQVPRLRKNAQFKRALDYGQIEITEKPIVFYFEKQQHGA